MATVADEKLALQMKALDAQISGLEAELAKAKIDLERAHSIGRPQPDAVRFKPILLTALAAMIGAATILLDPIFQVWPFHYCSD